MKGNISPQHHSTSCIHGSHFAFVKPRVCEKELVRFQSVSLAYTKCTANIEDPLFYEVAPGVDEFGKLH